MIGLDLFDGLHGIGLGIGSRGIDREGGKDEFGHGCIGGFSNWVSRICCGNTWNVTEGRRIDERAQWSPLRNAIRHSVIALVEGGREVGVILSLDGLAPLPRPLDLQHEALPHLVGKALGQSRGWPLLVIEVHERPHVPGLHLLELGLERGRDPFALVGLHLYNDRFRRSPDRGSDGVNTFGNIDDGLRLPWCREASIKSSDEHGGMLQAIASKIHRSEWSPPVTHFYVDFSTQHLVLHS